MRTLIALVALGAALTAATGIAIAQRTTNGRELTPAGRLTVLGNFPTGGAVSLDGRFYWAIDSGLGHNDVKIVDVASGAAVGSVGFWTKEWRDNQAYEIGWMVVPEFQGRGIAVAATAQAIELARRDDKHRFMHAFPNVDNAPSNAICRKLGFKLLEACEFEFPKGHLMTCNDWRLDLRA